MDYSSLAIGESVTFENGLAVSATAVEAGLIKYDNSTVTGVTVSYTNNGTSNVSFNALDWKAQDQNGALRSSAFYTDGENELHSGDLVPGGSVTGNIYFDGDIVKVCYYENLFLQSDTNIGWVI